VPLGWNERDLTDNANLVAAIAALPNQDAKEGFVHKVEGYCILWELDVDEFNTPSRYRARLGLPAQPPP